MRAFGLTVSILLHLLFGWLLFGSKLDFDWGDDEPRLASLDPPDAAATDIPTSDANANSITTTGPATPGRDAPTNGTRPPSRPPQPNDEQRGYDAGAAAFERFGFDEYYELEFGKELGDIMQKPVAQAWPELVSRLRGGEDRAAHALNALLAECTQDPNNADPVAARARHEATMMKGLGDYDRGYVSAYLDAERNWLGRRQSECAVAGVDRNSLDALVRERLAAVGLDPSPRTGIDALDRRDDLWSTFGEPPVFEPSPSAATKAWLDRIASSEPMDDAEFRELLGDAWDDPDLMRHLAEFCVADCEGREVVPFEWIDASQRGQWNERAAQFGIGPFAAMQAERLRESGDRIGALAWYDYLRWLEFSGCSPVPAIAVSVVGQAAEPIRQSLSPADQREAAARTATLVREYGAIALTLRRCP